MTDDMDPPAREWPQYPFPLKSRVKGQGVTGVVVRHPGPYSCEIKPDNGGVPVSISNSHLTLEGDST